MHKWYLKISQIFQTSGFRCFVFIILHRQSLSIHSLATNEYCTSKVYCVNINRYHLFILSVYWSINNVTWRVTNCAAQVLYFIQKFDTPHLMFILQLTDIIKAKTEVPRDVRNSKVRRQDKFRRDWSQHLNTCKSQSGTGPGVRRSKRPLLACRTRCKCSMGTSTLSSYNYQCFIERSFYPLLGPSDCNGWSFWMPSI